ncbi:hypothetical protein [Isoptericola sediminis]|uniref:Excisionase family DNA binding protein n=1 Tax=Isoptericola sediminis TaxID=2733572 RepID=A0A849K1F9_9MICO|nr:hypothetical protein [Isoptericola sediminis]NNU26998.1 hypothetical protein [Isoptericola sediminis]
MGGFMAVSEAAERLGVSVRQVQNLATRGELRKVARGLVDATSVERHLAVRIDSHTRAWSSSTAWAAISLLEGDQPDWLGVSQRSRLAKRLREISVDELVERSRGRAQVFRYAAHSSALRHLQHEVVHKREAELRLGLASSDAVDGYVAESALGGLVGRYGLARDDDGLVTLRATAMRLDVVRRLADRGPLLAAVDLAESLDVRERSAGRDALERALGEYRA